MKALYMETDASRVGLGASLLQTTDCVSSHKDEAPDDTILSPTGFASKSLSTLDKRYSDIEREALGIVHGLAKFYQYCFARGKYNN